jgi:hypothetical protein
LVCARFPIRSVSGLKLGGSAEALRRPPAEGQIPSAGRDDKLMLTLDKERYDEALLLPGKS